MLKRYYTLALFILVLSILGCTPSDQPQAYPTSGVVLFQGEPMKGGGAISFVPSSSLQGKAAGGEIRKDGTFVMSTYADGDGSIAGKFRVMIVQSVSQEPEMITPDGGGEPIMASGPIETVAKSDRIPFIYADPVKSPITVEITTQGPNDLKIDLKRM
ncbi:hypothetical protein [Bremerella alba]|uniref:Carboxypeptidase regulatory-like domain-containing protein n=1 Tax=Bremerella alba TaxID=980252 RepID=A0A7V9A7I3_9BACT|nr:hypothetical protein [Bremerella alba]MBA2115430.1 hypothetical protein [Bremerella alba]